MGRVLSEEEHPAAPAVSPTPPATVWSTRMEACRATEDATDVARVSTVVATADVESLTESLTADGGLGEDVLSVRVGVCRTRPVVQVAVKELDVPVPSVGQRGTPVLVHLALPYFAL